MNEIIKPGGEMQKQVTLKRLIDAASSEDWDTVDNNLPQMADNPEVNSWAKDGGLNNEDENLRDLAASMIEKSNIALINDIKRDLETMMRADENKYAQFRAVCALVNHNEISEEVAAKLKEFINDPDTKEIAEKYLHQFLPIKNIDLNVGLYLTETKRIGDYIITYNKNASDSAWNYAYIGNIKKISEESLSQIKEFYKGKGLRPAVYFLADENSKELEASLIDSDYQVSYVDAIMEYQGGLLPERNKDIEVRELEGDKDEQDYLEIYRDVYCAEGDDVYSGTSEGYLDAVKDYFKKYPTDKRLDLIAYKDGKPAGIVSVLFDDEHAVIMGLAVYKQFRKMGVAKELNRICMERFKDRSLFLDTEQGTENETIYKKLGFETLLVGKCYKERKNHEPV